MASRLKLDVDTVVGKLSRVWIWADQQSVDGNAVPVTYAFLDRLAGKKGFAVAMIEAGWLSGQDGALTFPEFARHNGRSAKARATTNRRVTKLRDGRNGNGLNGTNVTPPPLPKPLPDEDEDEEVIPPNPQGGLFGGLPEKPPKAWEPTEPMRRLNRLFKRRDATRWDRKELKAYRQLGEINGEDLERLERYYAARIPSEKDFRRRDLSTLLNHFRGEVDRARNYRETSPV